MATMKQVHPRLARRRVVATVALLLVALGVTGLVSAPASASRGERFFFLSVGSNTNPDLGEGTYHLVRGGMPASECPIRCLGAEPRRFRAADGWSLLEDTYFSTGVSVNSFGGYSGTVKFNVVGTLPHGITAASPVNNQSVFVDSSTLTPSPFVPFTLTASPDAPLGELRVTVRATDGKRVETAVFIVEVVDELPFP
jgi:hypothetical protein